jgi:hypothetical protein
MSRSIKATDQREAPIVYFDIELDDCQLTVYEYRAYGRIARRASGGKRSCTESLDSMALGCQMSRRSLINAIKGLIDRRMIARESKLGDTSTYYLTDKSNWIPGASRAQLTSAPDARGVVQEMPTRGAGDARGVVHHVPTKNTSKNTSKNTREERGEQPRQALVVTQAALIATPHTQGGADAVSVALEHFPQLGIWQQELIEKADINHGILWRQCCERWRDNRYSIRNITGLIDSYHKMEIQDNRERNNNGTNGTTPRRESHNERAARESFELIRRLTGQESSPDSSDPADTVFKLPAAFGGR